MNFFDRVHAITKTIPKGKVTTYGLIAKALGTKDARRVGHALHANKSSEVPCHRVVARDGSLAPSYAFGGEKEQMWRLKQEGVVFKGKKADLTKSLFTPPSNNIKQ